MMLLGFGHSAYLNKGIDCLVKNNGTLLVENASFLIPKKLEERTEINGNIVKLVDKLKVFKEIKGDESVLAWRKS